MHYKVLSKAKISAIGKKNGLSGDRLKVYTGFFKARFPKQYDAGYAGEWADRFKTGRQYTYGDKDSRRIMITEAKKLNYPTKFIHIRYGATRSTWMPRWETIKKVPYVKGEYKHWR